MLKTYADMYHFLMACADRRFDMGISDQETSESMARLMGSRAAYWQWTPDDLIKYVKSMHWVTFGVPFGGEKVGESEALDTAMKAYKLKLDKA
jgi:hypothetical protein